MNKGFLLLMSLILIIIVIMVINNSLKQEEGDMEDTILETNSGKLQFSTPPTPHDITFHNEDNKEVGRLEFTKEGMKFTGNADESAKIFFDLFLKGYVDEFIKDLLTRD